MGRRALLPSLVIALSMTGCATISDTFDKINPFSGKPGPKASELAAIQPTVEARVRWSVSIGKADRYIFAPAVVRNSVYAAAADGTVVRIDDGNVVWRIKAPHALSAGVGSDGKLVVVGTPKGEVLAFDAADGKPVWQTRVTSEVLAAPAVDDDGVAVRSGDNRVFLLDRKDGARKWFYQRSTPPLSLRNFAAPVFAERYLFVGFPAGKLVALDVKNGAPVWEGTVALPKGATELDRVADIVSLPVVDGRQSCAVAYQGRIACFDLGQGGQLLWGRDLSSSVGLAIDGRNVFLTDDKSAVFALDRNTGGSVWKQDKLLHRKVSAPLPFRNVVAVGDLAGVVHLLRREDGEFAARVSTDGTPIQTAPQTDHSSILVQTSGGTLTAIELK